MIKNDKKLIIFDLDGTLLDTSDDLKNAMNAMLSEYGFPLITVEQAKAYIGNGAKKFVYRSLPENAKELTDEALSRYNSFYNGCGSPCTHLYEGMDKVLKNCKEKGAYIAIISNKPQPSTDAVYEEYLKDYSFDYVYGRREGFGHKPEKECGEYVLDVLGCTKENTLVVGDGETDVRFAINLGVECVSVLWGYRSKAVLKQEGSKCFANTPEELQKKIGDFLAK